MEEKKDFSMEELLQEENSQSIKVGDIVEGEVIQVDGRVAYVDINQPTEGQIYLNYFTNDKSLMDFKGILKVGDKIQAKVTKIAETNEGMQILLSRLDMLKEEELKKLADQIATCPLDVTAVVKRINEKSYELAYNGIKLFMSIKDVKDRLQVGSKIDVKITEIIPEKGFGYASHYLIVKEQKEREHAEYVAKVEAEKKAFEESKTAFLESVKVGDELTGEVSKILGYGVVVKLDFWQGLIKLRELDHKFVKDPSEVVKVGDKVTVKIIKKDDDKIELSRKACITSPYQEYKKEHNVGDKVTGKVVNKLPFGILVELATDVTALLHKTEFSWNPNDNLMSSTLIGDEIEAAIIKMDDENEKINLSKKVLIDNPWERVNCNVGDETEALITAVSSKGLNVEAFGVDGFIPSRSVVLDGKSSKIEDYYAVGDKIKALVSEVNAKRWILTLDQKAYKNQEERRQFEEYMDNNNSTVEDNPTIGDLLRDELKK